MLILNQYFLGEFQLACCFTKEKNWQPIYVPHRGTWSDNGPLKYFLLQIPQIWSLRYWHLWPHGHDSNQWRHVATIAIIYTRIYPLIRGRDIFFFFTWDQNESTLRQITIYSNLRISFEQLENVENHCHRAAQWLNESSAILHTFFVLF